MFKRKKKKTQIQKDLDKVKSEIVYYQTILEGVQNKKFYCEGQLSILNHEIENLNNKINYFKNLEETYTK